MCDYDMFWFPFDSQSCGIKLYQKEDNVHLVPDGLTYGGPQHLEQYTVTGLRMCHTNIQVRQTLTAWARYILGPPWTCGDLYRYLSRANLHLRRFYLYPFRAILDLRWSLSWFLKSHTGLEIIFIFPGLLWTWSDLYLCLFRAILDLRWYFRFLGLWPAAFWQHFCLLLSWWSLSMMHHNYHNQSSSSSFSLLSK